jgi:hypothetical protein
MVVTLAGPLHQAVIQRLPEAVAQPGVFYHLAQCADLLLAGVQLGSGEAALLGDMNMPDAFGPLSDLFPDTQAAVYQFAAMGQRRGAGIIAGLELAAGRKRLDQGNAPAALAGTLLQGQCQTGTHQTATDNGYIDRWHGVLLLL